MYHHITTRAMKLSSLRIAWFLEGEALVDKYRGGHGIADSWGIRVHVARGGGGVFASSGVFWTGRGSRRVRRSSKELLKRRSV